MQKPCVTSNISIFKNVIDNEVNGFYCDSNSIKTFVQTIQKLIADSSLRDRVGKNARSHVKDKYSLENRVHKTFQIYRKIMDGVD